MYTAVYTLAADGHVGSSPVRNPAPRYLISRFMFSFWCATQTRYPRTIKGNIPTQKKKTRHMYEYTAVYMLAADGAAFDTYRKKEPLSFSEWGRVARYDSMVRGTPK